MTPASTDPRLEQPVAPRSRRDSAPVPAALEPFAERVRGEVELRLAEFLEARVAEARRAGWQVGAIAEALRDLALRGGKRLRPVLLAAAYEGCGGEGGSRAVAPAGVALELLQAYLLTHDDWMDGDKVRRGGPSVPAMMEEHFGAERVAETSVLAGDLAAAWSRGALFETPLEASRVQRAAAELARVEEQVVLGQILDVMGCARTAAEVEAMHARKSASYSVRGPIVMGAHLAGASEGQVAALAAFADPLGIAFQLRDDLLGVFGDSAATGKPAGTDLRKGRYSALVVDAVPDSGPVDRVFGRGDQASEAEVRSAVACLEQTGARERIEARIGELVEQARAALGPARLTIDGRVWLEAALGALTERQV
jgi:geranylgeranyl diphosphate synthase type I